MGMNIFIRKNIDGGAIFKHLTIVWNFIEILEKAQVNCSLLNPVTLCGNAIMKRDFVSKLSPREEHKVNFTAQ